MTIIKGLLIALLLVAGHSVPLQDDVKVADNEVEESRVEESEKYRLPKQVEPMHYDVKLIPHIVEDNFTTNGEMSIDVKVREPTNTIALHTVDITVDEPWTNLMRKSEEENADPVQTYVPKQHHYDSETQILTIRFEELLDLGTYTLHLKFAGILADDDRGFYRTFYTDDDGNKVWLAMTHFQPVRARQAFPCWDEPAIKATFKFSIKHYPNYTSLSNMPSMRTNVDESDGKVWTHFETTPLMSTNILGFVIADYDHVSNLDDTIRIWAPKKLLQYAPSRLEIAETAMREFEKYTNSSVHVPKMDHVTSPHYTSRATENWGMIVYKDAVLLSDERKGPIYSRLNNLLTLTHELAHQWFGNLVSPAWWQYLWLSEGTSTYLKYLIADKLIKDWRIMDCFVVDNVHYLFNLDSYPSRYQPRPINVNVTSHLDIHYAQSYSNTYMKSAIILHMIANVLTQDVFRNGLIRYLEAHEYGSVTPDDLWKALQDAVDESDVPHDDFKVKEVMDTWFEQAGYPIVTIERDYATGKIKATQKKFQYDPLELNITNAESDEAWWIPINFATQSNLDFSSTLPTHWLKPQDENLTIEGVDVNDWIIVNKQLTGFYLVNYDITNWKRIAAFLNSDDYDKIAPLNRAQIINDAFYMFKSKQLDIITYMEIVNYLWREEDPVVWKPVFTFFDNFDNLQRMSPIFNRYIIGLMDRLREHIGLDDHPDDNPLTEYVRAQFFNYACMYGDPICRAAATTKLLAYLQDPAANRLLYDSRYSIICFGLMTVNESVWNQVQPVLNKSDNNFMGCSTNLDILQKQLTFNVSSWFSAFNMFSRMLKDPSNVDKAIDLFINNFANISRLEPNPDVMEYHMTIIQFIDKCNNEDQLQKMEAFAKQHGLRINNDLTKRRDRIPKIKNTLSEIRNAFEKKQFSVAMHFADNTLSTD